MMKILVTAPYHENGLQELKEGLGEIVYRPWKPHGRAYNEEELIHLLDKTGAEALITEHDQVTRTVIESFPKLRFIGVCSGPPQNVSLDRKCAVWGQRESVRVDRGGGGNIK